MGRQAIAAALKAFETVFAPMFERGKSLQVPRAS